MHESTFQYAGAQMAQVMVPSTTNVTNTLSPVSQTSTSGLSKSQIDLSWPTTPISTITPSPQPPKPAGAGTREMVVSGITLTLKTAKTLLALAPIPNLDLVPTALLNLVELYKAVKDNDDRLAELGESIEALSKRVLVPISTLASHDASEDLINQINQLIEKLDGELQILHRIESQSGLSKTLGNAGVTNSIQRIKSFVDQAIRDFNVRAALQRLPVAQADFLSVPKDACTESTRMDIRKEIMSDLSDPSGRYVWLRGSAGLGKTAIAKSIAEQLNEDKRLAASFFFDKSGRTRNTGSSEYFITTLAFQLAEFYPPYRQALFRCLESRKSIISRPADERQLQDLILTPLESIVDSTSTMVSFPPSVIVLDGLDECGEPVDLEFLMVMVIALSKLPPTIRILVSCRPEREVIDAWSEHLESGVYVTHDVDKIPEASTHADILEHVQQSLKKLPSRHSVEWPPPPYDMALFAERCRGHFEIAHIRLRILQRSRGLSSEQAFKRLLQETDSRVLGVDAEYLRILRRAYPPPFSPDGLERSEMNLRTEVRQRYRTVVGTLLGLRDGRRLSSAGLALLLKMKKTEVEEVLGPISSIINVPDSLWEPITFFHATCPEFLRSSPLDTSEEMDKVFFFASNEENMLGARCLELLVRDLRPGRLLNAERYMDDPGDKTGMFFPLEYASDNWDAHLAQLPGSELPLDLLEQFMARHFLAWLELMLLFQLTGETESRKIGLIMAPISKRLASLDILLSREEFDANKWMRDVCACAVPRFPDEKDAETYSLSFIPSFFTELSGSIRKLGQNIEPFSLFKISLPHVDRGEAGPKAAYAHRTALSIQGHIVAMSFLDGRFDVVDSYTGESTWDLEPTLFWKSHPLPPLVWLEFVQDDSLVLGEDRSGRVWLIGRAGVLDATDPLPSPGSQAVAAISLDGRSAIRTSCQPDGGPWEQQMILLSVSGGRIFSQPLACPPTSKKSDRRIVVPRSLGFSPDGKHVGGFDDTTAHIWSAMTGGYLEMHTVTRGDFWTLNRWVDRQGIASLESLSFYPSPRPLDISSRSGQIDSIPCKSDDIVRTEIFDVAATTSSLFAVSGSGTGPLLSHVDAGGHIYCVKLVQALFHPHERLQMSIHPDRVLIGGGQNVRVVGERGGKEGCAPADLPEVFLPPILCLVADLDLVKFAAIQHPRPGHTVESCVNLDVTTVIFDSTPSVHTETVEMEAGSDS
ncbi:hypothetical protein HWV62_5546 [Athelia sp. TMB]|nr:hypothetical protein HWV62_5546 [Athelia sp. TMB]